MFRATDSLCLPIVLLAGLATTAKAEELDINSPPPPTFTIEQISGQKPNPRKPMKIGEYIDTQISTPHPYTAPATESPTLIWSRTIEFPGAAYIAPHFSRLELGPGDYLVVRSPDGKRTWRYRNLGPRNLGNKGGFWGIHIAGDAAVLELYSQSGGGGFGVKIDRYARGYQNWEMQNGLGTRALCGPDDSLEAKCYQGSEPEAYDKSRAVARLVLNGNAHCTGWLVGNEGHLMTNEHCITSQSQANDITIEMMAEGPDCATDCTSALGCPGTIEAQAPTLVTDNAGLDYALIFPDSTVNDLPSTYGFMRLRESGAELNERLFIPQHPAGWGKRIALESSHPGDPDGFGRVVSLTESACSGSGFNDVGYYLDTQGGSSGSPVLGYDDQEVVALHHCRGDVSCNASGGDPNRGVPIQNVIADLGDDLPSGAVCEPPDAPLNPSITVPGDNQIDVSWTDPGSGSVFNVYRSLGGCPANGGELQAQQLPGTSFADTDVSGGSTYGYEIATFDPAEACESTRSACVEATATGACTLGPSFTGLVSADNAQTSDCGIDLAWNAASANCGSNEVVYNIYRSTQEDFIPGSENLIESCIEGLNYTDITAQNGQPYFYTVRAEDDSGNGSGPCRGGNEDDNLIAEMAVATGPDSELFADDLESGTGAFMIADGPGDPGGNAPWSLTDTDANSPTMSLFIPDTATVADQVVALSTPITVPAGNEVLLEFWHHYATESTYDGGVLEYSVDSGSSWFDILAGNGAGVVANPDRIISNGYNSTISADFDSPIGGREAWSGSSDGFVQTSVSLIDFVGEDVQFRWRFASDASVDATGWWVDDIAIIQGSACQALPQTIFADGFEISAF